MGGRPGEGYIVMYWFGFGDLRLGFGLGFKHACVVA